MGTTTTGGGDEGSDGRERRAGNKAGAGAKEVTDLVKVEGWTEDSEMKAGA